MLVALVDDHQLFSAALAIALRSEGCAVVQPRLHSIEEVLEALLECGPDVALVDRDLGPIGAGDELIGPLASGGIGVVVVSALLDEPAIGRCLARGAAGCIPKSAPLDVVLAAVRTVAAGGRLLPDDERGRLIGAWRRSASAAAAEAAAFARLSPREAFVLEELRAGRAVRAIAAAAYVSEATVRSHVQSILHKLGVSSQLEAVALANSCDWRDRGPGSTAVQS